MGSSHSMVARMENRPPPAAKTSADGATTELESQLSSTPPPAIPEPQNLQTRVWKQFKERPLLPIGCGITGYFLFSGIGYFQKRDPVNSQRMMRNRVMAQFVTLACFLYYLGGDQADFRLAPVYQEQMKKKREAAEKENPES